MKILLYFHSNQEAKLRRDVSAWRADTRYHREDHDHR